jgi:hypothetical protein
MSSNATESFYSTTFKINIKQSDVDRFWRCMDKGTESECWIWKIALCQRGYGKFQVGRKTIRANRFAIVASGREIPDGMFSCHKCDNPPCCNPNHLFIGSPADNQMDMVLKGRSLKGDKNPSRIHPELYRGENNHAHQLTDEIVSKLRENPPIGANMNSEALKYAVSASVLRGAILGSTWKHLPSMSQEKIHAFLNSNPPVRVRISRQTADLVKEQLALGLSAKEIALKMGVHQRTVLRIASGYSWK